MNRTRFKVLNPFRESCFALGKFCKKYGENEIIAALPGTLGIMVFDTYEHAEEFMYSHLDHYCHMIIPVKPIGRGIRPTKIARHICSEDIGAFYDKRASVPSWNKINAPLGTMAYPAVLTLR